MARAIELRPKPEAFDRLCARRRRMRRRAARPIRRACLRKFVPASLSPRSRPPGHCSSGFHMLYSSYEDRASSGRFSGVTCRRRTRKKARVRNLDTIEPGIPFDASRSS
jgi:hypothetical protein